MSNHVDWVVGYAKQAMADFLAWNVLQSNPRVATCQRLHFLQMACEKLVKAHLCQAGSIPEVLRTSHAYVAKNLPIIARQHLAKMRRKPPSRHDVLLRQIKHLAREIELLAPAVDDNGQRPDNCEYPWSVGGQVLVPAEYPFGNLSLLTAPAGRTLLKILHDAIVRLLTDASSFEN